MDASIVALAQGAYFTLTGVWPLLHIASFMAVTGPKHDVWLVKTVGCCVAAIGVSLILGRDDVNDAVISLGLLSAAGLAAIDVVYSSRRVISRIYLLDAAAEAVLIAGWIAVLAGRP